MRAGAARAYELEADGSAVAPGRLSAARRRRAPDRATATARGRVLQEGADLGAARAPAIAALCLAVDAMIAIENRDWALATDLTDRAHVHRRRTSTSIATR